MGNAVTWNLADTNGFPTRIQLAEWVLTAIAAGTDSATTEEDVSGEVLRVELYTADTVADQATIKGYEEAALTAVGSRQDFLAYVKSGAAALSAEILPVIQRTTVAGVAVSAEYGPPVVAGKLTCAIAGFTEATSITVRAYIRG